MPTAPTPEPARDEELADAFRLLYSHLAPDERDRRVANALHLLELRELDRQGVFVLRDPGLVGVVVCLPVPGAGALVWPPRCVPDDHHTDHEDRLLRHAADWLRGQGVKLAQSLLTRDEVLLAEPLLRNGFRHVTHLCFLRHGLDIAAHLLNLSVRLKYRAYDEDDPALFHQTLQRTYEGTLDCPEINGVRTMDEVIAGHRSQGRFDPDRWVLALDAGRPVGVLLLQEQPDDGDWETAYVGVVPEARGRGFGRELMVQALIEARAGDAPGLALSVDGRNQPAWSLYRALGFEPYDRREVFLAIWT